MKAFLALLSAAFLLTPVTASAQTPRPANPQPTLVDGTGKIVGPMVDAGTVALNLEAQGAIVRVGVNAAGFASYNCPDVGLGGKCVRPVTWFTTSDCSGPTYLRVGSYNAFLTSAFRAGYVTPSHAIAFERAEVSVRHLLSSKDEFSNCLSADATDNASLISSVSIASLGFTPPFKVADLALSESRQPVLLDGTGKTVGPMIGPAIAIARIPPQSTLLALNVDRRGLISYNCDTVTRICNDPIAYYKSNDCSGKPYLRADELVAYAQFTPSMSEVAFPASTARHLRVLSESALSFCYQTEEGIAAASVQKLPFDALGITPPFTITLKSASPQPALWDAGGKLLGPMLSLSEALLDLPALPKLLRIGVGEGGFRSDQCRTQGLVCRDPLYFFVTPDCTGTKYLISESLITEAQVTPSDTLVYPGSPATTLTIHSVEKNKYGKDGGRKCEGNFSFNYTVGPLVSVSLASLGITLPYSVVLR